MDDTTERVSLKTRLSRLGHRLCVKHDFLSLQKMRGKTDHIRKFYDVFAFFYDFIYPRSRSYLEGASRLVRNSVRPGDRVLDLGAGTGVITLPMLPTALSIIAFDLHDGMLIKSRKKVLKAMKRSDTPSAGTSFCQGDAMSLPFRSDSFDLVASAFMMVYLNMDQKLETLKEVHRVLTPQGRLALLTFQGEIHTRFTPRAAWEEMLEEAGFWDIEVDDFDEVFRTIHALPRQTEATT